MSKKRKIVEVEGLDDLLTQITSLGKEADGIRKEVLHQVGLELQKDVQKKAKQLADNIETPDNVKYLTLEENIWLEWDEETKTTYVTTGNSFWAKFLEYGTWKLKKTPFMENTFRRNQKKLMTMMAEHIKRGLGL